MMRRQYAHRVTAYVDQQTGRAVDDRGRAWQSTSTALADIVECAPADVRRIYMVGPRPGDSADGLRSWILADPLYLQRSWRDDGTHLDAEAPTVRLASRQGGRRVEVYRMAAWFGEGSYSIEDACSAMGTLNGLLKERFDRHAEALSTPGVTGRDLWDRAPHPDAPVLDPDVRALIKGPGSSGQGRIEILTPPDLKRVPGVYCYDGILMYGGLCKDRELPVGPVTWDKEPRLMPYARARYLVGFRVPKGWSHVGLLPVYDAEERRWHYPCDPGGHYETWVDGCELELAQRYGWIIGIRQRLIFGKAKALDTWASRLLELREECAWRFRSGEMAAEHARMLMAAVRNMLLHTIGTFGRSSREAIRLYYPADAAQIDAPRLIGAPRRLDNGMWLARYKEELPAELERFAHPEWAAHIYALARARLLEYKPQGAGALLVPRQQVLAMRTDAIYLSQRQDWNGTRPGQFRLKGAIDRPVAAPHDERSILRLADQLEAS